MAELGSIIAAVLSGVLVAALVFYVWGRRVERRATEQSQRLVLAAKEELMAVRENLHKSLDQKLAAVDRRDQELRTLEQQLEERGRNLGKREQEMSANLSKREQEIGARLARVAGLTAQEAKAELITRLENEARDEAAASVRNILEQARKNADREAKKIVALAIQRIAAEQTAESSVSAVVLPSDEMKGRIIGREGRNIRAFEAATGVDVIIDDTPDTVVVSCFEPVRREVGRLLRLQGVDLEEPAAVAGTNGESPAGPARPSRPRPPAPRPQPIISNEPATFIRIVWPADEEITFYPQQRRYVRIETDANSTYFDPNDPMSSRINIVRPESGLRYCGASPLRGGRMRAVRSGTVACRGCAQPARSSRAARYPWTEARHVPAEDRQKRGPVPGGRPGLGAGRVDGRQLGGCPAGHARARPCVGQWPSVTAPRAQQRGAGSVRVLQVRVG